MGSSLLYGVYATHTDPDDLPAYNYVGARKSKAGAQTLAEKFLGKRIYGFKKVGDAYGKDILETWPDKSGDPVAKLEFGWHDPERSKEIEREMGRVKRSHTRTATRPSLPPGTTRG
jgi:hypothetical protein